MEEQKKRFGDRRDAVLLRNIDAMHFLMPNVLPNRCDNEAYISERIDLTQVNAWLEKKNRTETEFPYTLFHVIVAALLKVIYLRPKMNRFIANKNLYQRKHVSASFVIKKRFADESEEGLAFVYAQAEDTVEQVHETIRRQVSDCRAEKGGQTSDNMDVLNKLPRWLSKAAIRFICTLDRHGHLPRVLTEDNPYYASVFLSNLGSIKLKCGYHHLANWGTNSFFCVIGEKKMTPVFDGEGKATMRETVDLGLTVDERIADGYYYAGTVRLFKELMEHPELLERPMAEGVELS